MSAKQKLESSSTRPYLIRALHEWCCDNGLTPYISVSVDGSVQVPLEYVKDDEIVLNIGFDATTELTMGNEYIEFKARFSGVVRDIIVPVDQVIAIFARENGQGMAFPKVDLGEQKRTISKDAARPAISLAKQSLAPNLAGGEKSGDANGPTPGKSTVSPSKPTKPSLTRVK